MSKTKQVKPSSSVTLDGLPEVIQLWSKTIPHPAYNAQDIEGSIANDSAYADTNANHKRGDQKKIMVHFTNAEMDMSHEYKGKVYSLKYKGINYRFPAEKVTASHLKAMKSYRTAQELNSFDLMAKAWRERLIKKVGSASYNFNADQINLLREYVAEETNEAFDMCLALIAGVKPEEEIMEDRFAVQIG